MYLLGPLNLSMKHCRPSSYMPGQSSPSCRIRAHAAPSSLTSLYPSSTRFTIGKSNCSTSLLVPMLRSASRPNHIRPSVCQAGTVTQSPTILMEINHTTTLSLSLPLALCYGRVTSSELAIDRAQALSSSHGTVARRRRRFLVSQNGTFSPQLVQMVPVASMSIWGSQVLFSLRPMLKSGD